MKDRDYFEDFILILALTGLGVCLILLILVITA